MLTFYRKNKAGPSFTQHHFSPYKNGAGFTLIELLVVIAIIGILASVVLASLNNARRKSRDARRITDLKQIGLALQLYYDGIGVQQYPLGVTVDAPCTNDSGLTTLVTNGYIPSIPRDPSSPTTCYRYASGEIAGLRTTFHVAGVLEDASNPALNAGDRDCSSDGVNTPNCAAGATWAGTPSNGNDSADCVVATVAGTDQCYDVVP